MRELYIKTLQFFIVSFMICMSFAILTVKIFPHQAKYIFFHKKWLLINSVIESSKAKINSDTLYIGDSVGKQFFTCNFSNQLTTNGGVNVIGNYFLIKNVIKKNKIKHVFYLTVPHAFSAGLNRNMTNNYFVKPFYNNENKEEILSCEITRDILKKNKYFELNRFLAYKLLPLDDFDYSSDIHRSDYSYNIANESIVWLKKIDSLCSYNNVELHLISPPVAKSHKIKSEDWSEFRLIRKNKNIQRILNDYINNIMYVDDKYIKDDKIHFKPNYIKKYKSQFKKTIL